MRRYSAYLSALLVVFAGFTCTSGESRILTVETEKAPFSYQCINLLPQTQWEVSGDIWVREDGRIYLSADGKGMLKYRVLIDTDKFPYLMVRMGDSLPRPLWSISVSRAGGVAQSPLAHKLVETIEEGEWLLPLRQEPNCKGHIYLDFTINITGKKNDWIVLDYLKAVSLSDNLPPAPVLDAPVKQVTVRNFAVHFIWKQVPDAVAYEVQYSKSADFPKIESTCSNVITSPFIAYRLYYLPGEAFEEGNWFWRARGINKNGQAGEWSPPASFTVSAEFKPAPPERAVSSANPLLIFFSDTYGMEKNWASLDESIRKSAYLRIEEHSPARFREVCELAEKNRIPILIQVSGPHDYYGTTSSRISLSEVEEYFQKYKMVKGAFICEQACQYNGLNNPVVSSYISRLIKLAAHYGRLAIWADGHWGRYQWLDVCKNAELLGAIRNYKEYFAPVWKMNCGATPYSVHGALLGLWLSDTVNNWGVEPENWYWFEAGFRDINEQKWFKEGAPDKMPASFYGQMMLLGITSGAAVYVLEPPSAVWAEPGKFSVSWHNSIHPLINEVLNGKILPDKDTVRSLVKQSVTLPAVPPWQPEYDPVLRNLYNQTYKPSSIFDVLPKTNSYFIPIFLPGTQGGCFSAAGFETAPADTAWTVTHHNIGIAMNTYENKTSRQKYELALSGDFKNLSGMLDSNGYVIVRQIGPTTVKILVFGREGRINKIGVKFNQVPAEYKLSFAKDEKGWRTEFDKDALSLRIIPEPFKGMSEEITISTKP